MTPLYGEMRRLPSVARDVVHERERQTAALRRGLLPWDCADPEADKALKLGVLGEEYGEVCKAIIEGQPLSDLYAELVQVAAVACAFAEAVSLELRP
jgi:hypothetical protein